MILRDRLLNQRRTIEDRAATLLMVGLIPVFLWVDSCDRIEFEPESILYITTDSVQTVDLNTYRLSGSILNMGKEDILEHGFCWSDHGTPTIEGPSVKLGSTVSTGSYSAIIHELQPKTTYYFKAYASTKTGTTYGEDKVLRTPAPDIDPTVTDIDGNIYPVAVIGQQVWMAENLRVTRYADGTPIPLVDSDSAWEEITVIEKAFSWYEDNPDHAESLGAFYSWAAAMNGAASSETNPSGTQGVCPDGWHLPSDAEWNQMQLHLGMRQYEADRVGFQGTRANVGTKMKGIGDPLWEDYSEFNPFYNESGFNALPCGLRNSTGGFDNVGKYTYFWSSTDYSGLEAWYRYLQRGHRAVLRVHIDKRHGFSVRCVMDE